MRGCGFAQVRVQALRSSRSGLGWTMGYVEAMLFQEATRPELERGVERWTRSPLGEHTDERLALLVSHGEDAAFELLYQRYSSAIQRYARRRVASEQEAEDVHQQVFLSAYSALRTGVAPVRFKSWLYRIAHNVCVSELRARKPASLVLDDDRAMPSVRADALTRDREELRELLDDLASLPRPHSGALLLREINDLSYAEIGEALHLPVATVRSHIFRARTALHALAAAREADCVEIQAELSRVAGRPGRRSSQVTNHLRVCSDCEAFRSALCRRPAVLSLLPLVPAAWSRPLRALAGAGSSDAAAGGLVVVGATATGGALGAKVAAFAASMFALSVGGMAATVDSSPDGRSVAASVPAQAYTSGSAAKAPSGRVAPVLDGGPALVRDWIDPGAPLARHGMPTHRHEAPAVAHQPEATTDVPHAPVAAAPIVPATLPGPVHAGEPPPSPNPGAGAPPTTGRDSSGPGSMPSPSSGPGSSSSGPGSSSSGPGSSSSGPGSSSSGPGSSSSGPGSGPAPGDQNLGDDDRRGDDAPADEDAEHDAPVAPTPPEQVDDPASASEAQPQASADPPPAEV